MSTPGTLGPDAGAPVATALNAIVEKSCERCGGPLKRKKQARFCSESCRKAAWEKRRRGCPSCGCRMYHESGPCAGEALLAACKLAEKWLMVCMPVEAIPGPTPLPVLRAAMAKAEGSR